MPPGDRSERDTPPFRAGSFTLSDTVQVDHSCFEEDTTRGGRPCKNGFEAKDNENREIGGTQWGKEKALTVQHLFALGEMRSPGGGF
jgi:hypothetical protein